MAPDQNGMGDLLAVAFVVDSTLAVAMEWRRLILEYAWPMLKRLTEANPGYKLRLAFISYGTAASPSPLLCKNFFADFAIVRKEMEEVPDKLGIGHTISGGDDGMSTLEGLLAAVELFDILRGMTQARGDQARPHVCHIFHISSSFPDAMEHAQMNDLPHLDNVSWDSLPTELKKRSINLDCISIGPPVPRISELYSASMTGSSITPWFPLHPSHSVLLGAGFTSSIVPKSAKRPGDPQNTDRTPESKRQRTGPSLEASPSGASATTPTLHPKPVPEPQPQSQPPQPQPAHPQPQPQPQPPKTPQIQPPQPLLPPQPTQPLQLPPQVQPTPTQPPPQQPQPSPHPPPGPLAPLGVRSSLGAIPPQQILVQIRSLEVEIRKIRVRVAEAQANKNSELVNQLALEWKKLKDNQDKFKHMLTLIIKQQQEMAKTTTGTGINASSTHPPAMVQKDEAPLPSGSGSDEKESIGTMMTNLAAPNQQLGPQGIGSMAHGRSLSGSGMQLHNSPANATPNQHQNPPASQSPVLNSGLLVQGLYPNTPPHVLAQMNKLIEQRQRTMSGAWPSGSTPNHNMAQSTLPSQTSQPPLPSQLPPPPPHAADLGTNTTGAAMATESQPGFSTAKPHTPIWQGTLSWSGFSPGGQPKEVRASVVAFTEPQHKDTCKTNTWPPILPLVPAREPPVSLADLQGWIKRTNPALCTLRIDPTVSDPANEHHYRALIGLLTSKNLYAVAAWTTPSGRQTSNMLVFPVKLSLVGAVFPLDGIPEMPKATALTSSSPSPLQLQLQRMTLEQRMQLQRMTPEQRRNFFAQASKQVAFLQNSMAGVAGGGTGMNAVGAAQNPMMSMQQQQQQQLHMQDLPSNGSSPFGGQNQSAPYGSNQNMLLGLLGAQGPHQSAGGHIIPGGMMVNASLPRPMSGGMQGGPGGISGEMMQSFARRNGEGGLGMDQSQ